ncbi:porin family protein [Catalinimonas sp. 4WD22]|uniref:porin family protein n=1 Tax=Catalinimonas locisalis TaxID=3133978 RepID=UPI00310174E0
MKKLIFSFVLLVFLSSAAMAQVQFGLKAGAMWSNTVLVEPDSLSGSYDAKISYLLGGFMTIPISSKFNVQPEVFYASKGDQYTNRHYINLPVMLQYQVINKLKVEVGPEIGYMLAAYSKFPGSEARSRWDIEDFDIGINVGASYAILDRWIIGLRYNMGIYNTHGYRSFVAGSGLPDYNIQNRTLQLSVGWKLGK